MYLIFSCTVFFFFAFLIWLYFSVGNYGLILIPILVLLIMLVSQRSYFCAFFRPSLYVYFLFAMVRGGIFFSTFLFFFFIFNLNTMSWMRVNPYPYEGVLRAEHARSLSHSLSLFFSYNLHTYIQTDRHYRKKNNFFLFSVSVLWLSLLTPAL